MLHECRSHGYFRGKECPICGGEGRFLLNEDELDRIGRTLAGVLRHFPDRFDITLDEHGWANIYDFIDALKRKDRRIKWLKPHHVHAIIQTDSKGRYQIRGDMIRATYGHSIDVDLDLPTTDIPEHLYYPTSEEELDILLETGLKPVDRKMVHLSETYAAAREAGRHRVQNPMILQIDANTAMENGIIIMHAGTTVYLSDGIPADFITKAEIQEDVEDESSTLSEDISLPPDDVVPEPDTGSEPKSNPEPKSKEE